MGLEGDIGQLTRLGERLAELAEVPSRTARAASEAIEAEIQDEFDQGHDPYEEPWKPLAPATVARGRSAPPLTDTGAMRDSLRVKPLAGAGIGVTIDHPAGPHQTGWEGRQGSGPARPILPARGELPDAWIEILERTAEAEFRKGVERR
jgi:phage gpG-like protein